MSNFKTVPIVCGPAAEAGNILGVVKIDVEHPLYSYLATGKLYLTPHWTFMDRGAGQAAVPGLVKFSVEPTLDLIKELNQLSVQYGGSTLPDTVPEVEKP